MLLPRTLRQKCQKVCSTLLLEITFDFGKLTQPCRTEIINTGSSGSKRLHIRDISSGVIFLIDSGSDISLFSSDSSVLLGAQISFKGFFGDLETLFRIIGTMYVIQSIAHLFLLPLTIFQAAYGYRV